MKFLQFSRFLYFTLFALIACTKREEQPNPNPPGGTDPLAPVITAFNPPSAIPGSEILIQGSNFSTTLSENTVKFNGVQGMVVNGSGSFLIAKIPVTATNGKISVTVGTKTGYSLTDLVVIHFSQVSIDNFSPGTGKTGDLVTINGSNFYPQPFADTVKFNGIPATVVAATATQLNVRVPAGATTGNLTVKVGSYTATSATAFTVVDSQVSTLAGSGQMNSTDGTGTSASFAQPKSIAMDAAGNFFVADRNSRKIRKVTPAGVVTTFATLSQSNIDPTGIKVDAAGNIFIADRNTNSIRKITPAGVESVFYWGQLNFPEDLVIDGSGNIYVTDLNNHRVCKISAAGVFSVMAGSDTSQSYNGTGLASRFNFPKGITIDIAGNLYVADLFAIRKITQAGVVTTYSGLMQGFADGPLASALFNNLQGLNFDNAGNLYVTELSRIRKISVSGIVTTIAGDGIAGFIDGPGSIARFNDATSVVADAAGILYVADQTNNRIRRIVQ